MKFVMICAMPQRFFGALLKHHGIVINIKPYSFTATGGHMTW